MPGKGTGRSIHLSASVARRKESVSSPTPTRRTNRDRTQHLSLPRGRLPPISNKADAPDAELLRLGRLFDTYRATELRAWAVANRVNGGDDSVESQRAYEIANIAYDVSEQILKLQPATTLEGLLVKYRIISWQHGGNPVPAERINECPDLATEMMASILADLAAMQSPRRENDSDV